MDFIKLHWVIFGLLFLLSDCSELYTKLQTLLQGEYEQKYGIDITDDNSILAIACYDSYTYIYTLNSTNAKFDYQEKHYCGDYDDTEFVDFTPDKEYMVITCYQEPSIVLKKKQNQNSYTQVQRFKQSGLSFSNVITNDAKYIIEADSDNDLYVHEFNESSGEFDFSYHFELPYYESIRHLSIGADYSYLITSIPYIQEIYVFKYSNSNEEYEWSQTIPLNSDNFDRRTFLTSDNEYLLIPDENLEIYKLNSEAYEPFKSIKLAGNQWIIYYAQLTEDKSHLIVLSDENIKIYSNPLDEAVLEQQFEGWFDYFKISKDEKYLIITQQQQSYIYILNPCIQPYQFEQSTGKCVICSEHCVECENQYYCAVCNQTQQYFSSIGQCRKCQLENCQTCKYLTKCQKCDEGYQVSQEEKCIEIQEQFQYMAVAIAVPIIAVLLIAIVITIVCLKKRPANQTNQTNQVPESKKELQGNNLDKSNQKIYKDVI